MRRDQDNALEALMEQLIESGTEEMASVFAGLFNLAMRIERERFLRAGHYERSSERRGYANGSKPKKLDTPAGTVRLQVPKTAGHEEPFYPQALERGRRSCRAVMLAVAEMYVKGVSSRSAEAVMKKFGLESLSSSQFSRAANAARLSSLASRSVSKRPIWLAEAAKRLRPWSAQAGPAIRALRTVPQVLSNPAAPNPVYNRGLRRTGGRLRRIRTRTDPPKPDSDRKMRRAGFRCAARRSRPGSRTRAGSRGGPRSAGRPVAR